MEKSKFARIEFDIKKQAGVTLNEYVLLEMVFYLQQKTGWCYSSKDYFADCLDVSRQTIHNIINNLINKGYLERTSESKFLKTTTKWTDFYIQKDFTECKESLHNDTNFDTNSVKKVYTECKESLHNINNYINNNINTSSSSDEVEESELKVLGEIKPNIKTWLYEHTEIKSITPTLAKEIIKALNEYGEQELKRRIVGFGNNFNKHTAINLIKVLTGVYSLDSNSTPIQTETKQELEFNKIILRKDGSITLIKQNKETNYPTVDLENERIKHILELHKSVVVDERKN